MKIPSLLTNQCANGLVLPGLWVSVLGVSLAADLPPSTPSQQYWWHQSSHFHHKTSHLTPPQSSSLWAPWPWASWVWLNKSFRCNPPSEYKLELTDDAGLFVVAVISELHVYNFSLSSRTLRTKAGSQLNKRITHYVARLSKGLVSNKRLKD